MKYILLILAACALPVTAAQQVIQVGKDPMSTTQRKTNANFTELYTLVGGGFDATAVDAVTWSDGGNASNLWTFAVSGTDPTLLFANGAVTVGGTLTATGGYIGPVGAGTIDASGFNGNLAVTDNTVQEIAQKLDDLVASSGSVATDTIFDAAGDLVVGTGANTAAKLPIGSPGEILHVNGGGTAPEYTDSPSVTNLTVTGTATIPAINFNGALGTDDTASATRLTGLLAGATIAQWEAVYIGASSTYLLADANGSGTYPVRGLAIASYTSTNATTIVTSGTVRNDSWTWTPGGTIFLSTTAGGLTQTAPSTTGDKIQVIGYALTADIIYVAISPDYGTAP